MLSTSGYVLSMIYNDTVEILRMTQLKVWAFTFLQEQYGQWSPNTFSQIGLNGCEAARKPLLTLPLPLTLLNRAFRAATPPLRPLYPNVHLTILEHTDTAWDANVLLQSFSVAGEDFPRQPKNEGWWT